MSKAVSRRSLLGIQDATPTGSGKPLRVGLVGIGSRGSDHLDALLNTDSVEIKALCDVDEGFLYRAKKWVEATGKRSPELYSRGKTDYLRLCDRDDLDLVVTATPWQYHAPVCLAAMRAGKHAATEVPAALTMEQCWELVETAEKSGKQCTMLEEENYDSDLLAVLHMAQRGIFGDLLHATGGYVHDLRLVQFDPEREPWRLQTSIDLPGNAYPTHPMGPMAWWLDINRGDKIDSLVSMSTKARCLNDYASHFYGERSPYASMPMACGDVNTTLLQTAGGKTIALYFDTSTPHPHTAEFRLQGTRGIYAANTHKIYIEGRSPKASEWEPFENYAREFQSPLWKNFNKARFKTELGHGEGATTDLMWSRLAEALRTGSPPDQNVYDAVSWSCIIPLSARSVGAKSTLVDFPDFTRGKWKDAPPIKFS